MFYTGCFHTVITTTTFLWNTLHSKKNSGRYYTCTYVFTPNIRYPRRILMKLEFQRLTYLLTPWCRVLLKKLTDFQLVKKFPAYHGTRRFITALTSVRHLSLSWASPIQSIYLHPTSWRSVLILSTHLRLGLPNGLFPSGFPTKTLYTPCPHPYLPHAQTISFFSILSPAQYWVKSTDHLASRYAISSIPPLPRPSPVQIFSSTPYSQNTLSFLSSRNVSDQVDRKDYINKKFQ